jgi:hypothetical protein
MVLAKYSNKEIADVAFRCFLQHTLLDRSLKGLRLYIAGEVAPLPAPPDCSEQHQNCAINDNIEGTPSIDHAVNHVAGAPATRSMPSAFSTEPNPDKVSPVGTFVGTSTATEASKCKQINHTYYLKKKMRALSSSPAVMRTTTMTTMRTTVTTMTATAAAMTAMVETPILKDH